MLKPASLRAALTTALPELAATPDRLSIFIKEGQLASIGAPGLSFEYRYTLELLLFDFARHADALMLPLLAWVRRHQPDLVENPDRQARAIRFEAEILGPQAVDLSIQIDLTESVRVRRRAGGGHDVVHLPEPPRQGAVDQAEHWAVYLRDELLVEFDLEPEQAWTP